MNTRRMLMTATAGCAIALASAGAMGAPTPCPINGTIADWKASTGGAGVCQQGDKVWTLGTTNLADSVRVLFTTVTVTHHIVQLINFDVSDAAATWFINYTVTVTDPLNSFIADVHAGVDNPGGGSVLTKTVAGDPGGPFTLTNTDGAGGPTAEKHGLKATTLNVTETFSVNAGANMLSVSNSYFDILLATTGIPTLSQWVLFTAALLLLAAGLVALRGRASTRSAAQR